MLPSRVSIYALPVHEMHEVPKSRSYLSLTSELEHVNLTSLNNLNRELAQT